MRPTHIPFASDVVLVKFAWVQAANQSRLLFRNAGSSRLLLQMLGTLGEDGVVSVSFS